jgi:hypothetical protein
VKRLVEFASESGDVIVVEAEDLDPNGGTTRRGLPSSALVERAQASFEDALEKAQPIATGLIDRLRSIADTPDEVQVEFGLTLSANVGAVLVAAGSAGANYKVTLKWNKTSEE